MTNDILVFYNNQILYPTPLVNYNQQPVTFGYVYGYNTDISLDGFYSGILTTGATISASQTNGETRTVTRVITNSKGETSTVTVAELITTDQSTTFNTPQTRTQIQQSIQGKLAIIERYLNRFYELLRGWVLD